MQYLDYEAKGKEYILGIYTNIYRYISYYRKTLWKPPLGRKLENYSTKRGKETRTTKQTQW